MIKGKIPKLKKYIIIAEPHTSHFDFFVALYYCSRLKILPKFLIKYKIFKLLGWYTPGGAVKKIVGDFNRKHKMILVMAPSGSITKRKRKTGYKWISRLAKVPVVEVYWTGIDLIISKPYFP